MQSEAPSDEVLHVIGAIAHAPGACTTPVLAACAISA